MKTLKKKKQVIVRLPRIQTKEFLIKYWLAVSAWIFLVSVLACLWFIQKNHYFSFQRISCRVGENECPDYVQAELKREQGASVLSRSLYERTQKISTLLPSLHQFKVDVQLPNAATVTFTPAQAVYLLHRSDHPYLTVDESGTIVGEETGSPLPVFDVQSDFYDNLHLRDRLDQETHHQLLILLSSLSSQHIEYQHLEIISEEEIEVTLADQKKVQLLTKQVGPEVDKLGYLLKFVDMTKIKQPVRIIDLRFKYPILKT
jgi:hypothetical protein